MSEQTDFTQHGSGSGQTTRTGKGCLKVCIGCLSVAGLIVVLLVITSLISVTVTQLREGEKKVSDSPKNTPTQSGKSDEKKKASLLSETTPEKLEDILAELDSLTGLKPVKEEVRRIIAMTRTNKLRLEQGITNAVKPSYNFVFTGNPGTGKTTVARILGRAFRALGVLKKGQFIETDRSGLVAGYTGQTALKTNTLIDEAMGGVLFIDEAYQLSSGSDDAYGKEALATLLKRMEDARGDLVVIVAGYKKEMGEFMDANSGLESRFNRVIEFPDYSAADLTTIFRSMVKKGNYKLSADVEKWIGSFISVRTKERTKNFGNARWARNLFEKSIERQAVRLSEISEPTKEQLETLTMKDIGIVLKDPNASQED